MAERKVHTAEFKQEAVRLANQEASRARPLRREVGGQSVARSSKADNPL